MKCENCGNEHNGSYGSGRFCCQKCARSFSTKYNRKEISIKVSNTFKKKNKKLTKKCLICGKILRYNNKSGYCRTCIRTAPELKEFRSKMSKYAWNCVKIKTHWAPRNQISYAEQFWIQVLNTNNIPYEREYTVFKDNTHWYYLDFYIEKNNNKLDLEIDGKQHKYEDHKQHDIERDKFLKSKNYIVYRIDWNEINSNAGKDLMKEKIDKFLNFYYKL